MARVGEELSASGPGLLLPLAVLPEVVAIAGVGIGCYIRWQLFGFTLFPMVGAVGLLLIFARFFFRSCTKSHHCLIQMLYVWLGCSLGLVGLLDVSPNLQHQFNQFDDISNLLLVSSLICRAVIDLLFKCCASRAERWWGQESAQLVGAAVASVVASAHSGPLLVLAVALFCVILIMKSGSLLSFAGLVYLTFTAEHYLFPDLGLSVNPYAFICLVGRVSCGPALDVILSSRGRLERWKGFITAPRFRQRFLLTSVGLLELAYFLCHSSAVKNHKEWYLVVPFFVATSLLWLLMHATFLIILGSLINRFGQCRDSLGAVTGLSSFKKVLASRGLRYFSLVAYRVMFLCLLSSTLVSLLCWTTRTPYSHSLFVMVASIEVAVTELLYEFSVNLGGTCIGYGVVAPTTSLRSDGLVTVLPPTFIQESGNRSTRTLQAIVDFFTQHLITNFGCDWSMSGIRLAEIEKKTVEFFAQTTPEGSRFDTYLYFYSGPSTLSGDWALSENQTMSLERLMELWEEQNTGGCSRLLLVCDSDQSWQWTKKMRKLRQPVALQAVRLLPPKAETESVGVGDLTRLWFRYNATGERAVLDSAPRCLRPTYAVSRHWTTFRFHTPTREETRIYWQRTLPRFTHPVLSVVVSLLSAPAPFLCFETCLRIFRRFRMAVWPPSELDTGHGFKLIRL